MIRCVKPNHHGDKETHFKRWVLCKDKGICVRFLLLGEVEKTLAVWFLTGNRRITFCLRIYSCLFIYFILSSVGFWYSLELVVFLRSALGCSSLSLSVVVMFTCFLCLYFQWRILLPFDVGTALKRLLIVTDYACTPSNGTAHWWMESSPAQTWRLLAHWLSFFFCWLSLLRCFSCL